MTFIVAAQIAQTTLAFSLGQLRPVVVVGITPATDDLDRLVTQRDRGPHADHRRAGAPPRPHALRHRRRRRHARVDL
jgi:hypothetical protein